MGGSVGSAEAEKLVRAFELASFAKLPIVGFTSSSGARVQEGLYALMQVPKIVAAISKFRMQTLPYISVICDPTMGGPMISFALLGDFKLAEPRARVSFAGARVKHHESEVTSEMQLEWGAIDEVLHRHELRNRILDLLS